MKQRILRLNIAQLPDAGEVLNGELTDAILDLAADGPETAISPVRYHLTARRVGPDVLIRGEVAVGMRFRCDRCGGAYDETLEDGEFCHFLERPEDEVVDLAEPVRESVLLKLPAKRVCREDCRGICPNCGQDLNEGSCECSREDEPPPGPWDSLDELTL